jgi:hypothetical protein
MPPIRLMNQGEWIKRIETQISFEGRWSISPKRKGKPNEKTLLANRPLDYPQRMCRWGLWRSWVSRRSDWAACSVLRAIPSQSGLRWQLLQARQ